MKFDEPTTEWYRCFKATNGECKDKSCVHWAGHPKQDGLCNETWNCGVVDGAEVNCLEVR